MRIISAAIHNFNPYPFVIDELGWINAVITSVKAYIRSITASIRAISPQPEIIIPSNGCCEINHGISHRGWVDGEPARSIDVLAARWWRASNAAYQERRVIDDISIFAFIVNIETCACTSRVRATINTISTICQAITVIINSACAAACLCAATTSFLTVGASIAVVVYAVIAIVVCRRLGHIVASACAAAVSARVRCVSARSPAAIIISITGS
jgi:hypothetical protein